MAGQDADLLAVEMAMATPFPAYERTLAEPVLSRAQIALSDYKRAYAPPDMSSGPVAIKADRVGLALETGPLSAFSALLDIRNLASHSVPALEALQSLGTMGAKLRAGFTLFNKRGTALSKLALESLAELFVSAATAAEAGTDGHIVSNCHHHEGQCHNKNNELHCKLMCLCWWSFSKWLFGEVT